jgi:hypothetical protein
MWAPMALISGGGVFRSWWTASAQLAAGQRRLSFGPLDFSDFIPGWKSVWLTDPEGNVVQVTQGFVDQENPPPLPA